MNIIGKIFVFAVFIMSLVFMSFGVALYSTHTNWREEIVKPGGLNDQLQNARNEATKLQEEINELTTDVKESEVARDTVIAQIQAQLGRIVSVHDVHDLTTEGSSVERELAMFKVSGEGERRVEALRIAEIFRANVVDSTLTSFVFEITGAPEKIDAFADLMRPLGLTEIARTGVAALMRGA